MQKKEKRVCVSGYFNPLHVGHIKMFEEAKKLGDRLIVIVNNDEQVLLKGSVPFMSEYDRALIASSMKMVDWAIIAKDKDKTVCETIRFLQPDIFANGGDRRGEADIPEAEVCRELGIEMVFNVGGDKIRNSSELINKAINHAKNN